MSPPQNPLVEWTERELVELEVQLEAEPNAHWVILDSTDEPRVLEKVETFDSDRAISLFGGYSATKFREVAPYLVRLDAALLRWVKETVWDDPWGIFVESTADIRELRRHLRSLLMVKSPEGEDVYFRYYDYRVLPVVLDQGTQEELDQLFGPVVLAYAWNEDDRILGARPKQRGQGRPAGQGRGA